MTQHLLTEECILYNVHASDACQSNGQQRCCRQIGHDIMLTGKAQQNHHIPKNSLFRHVIMVPLSVSKVRPVALRCMNTSK